MSVLHITCKHWLGNVTIEKQNGGVYTPFLSGVINNDITLYLPEGVYIVRQSEVDGKVNTDYPVILTESNVVTLEITWKNANIATLADQEKVRYDGVSSGLHYAFGI